MSDADATTAVPVVDIKTEAPAEVPATTSEPTANVNTDVEPTSAGADAAPSATERTADSAVPASRTEAAADSSQPKKTLVAELPTKQPAGISDAVIPATLLEEAPPQREGKTEDEVLDLANSVAQLVTFYFSDSNLPNDRYLFSLTACNEPMYGWVPLSNIITFSRMRALNLKPVDVPFVAWAIRRRIAAEGEDSILAIGEDGVNVRRKRIVEKDGADMWARSAYVKGFGARGEEDEKTQDNIEKYMRQFGLINSVRMRREDAHKAKKGKGKFKGSIFVEFAALPDLEAFIKLESIPKYLSEGPEMEKSTKEEYCVRKAAEKGISAQSIMTTRGADSQQSQKKWGNGNIQPFNAFKEMANLKEGRRANLSVIKDDADVVGKPIPITVDTIMRDKRKREDDGGRDGKKVHSSVPLELSYNGGTVKVDRQTGAVLDKSEVKYTENSVLVFKGEGKGADWKLLKEAIMKVIPAPFLAAPPGTGGGKLAKTDSSAISDEELKQLQDAKLKHGDQEITWSRPSEREMQDFWANRAGFQGAALAKKLREAEREAEEDHQWQESKNHGKDRGGRGGNRDRGGRGGRNRGGRGGRGGNRGGRGGHRDNGADSGLPPTLSSA